MSYTIRPYVSADRQQLVATVDAVCRESPYMMTAGFTPTPMWEHALTAPECPRHLLLVAVAFEQVVGWCRLFPIARPSRPAWELGIGILGPWRGRGVGTQMIRAAQAWASRVNGGVITLSVHPDNTGAIRLYDRLGFRPVSTMWPDELRMIWFPPEDEPGHHAHNQPRAVVGSPEIVGAGWERRGSEGLASPE